MSKVSNTEEFIEKARKIHRDKYDYSKVEYKNNHTKVCIICPEHGEFWQIPKEHLNGCGCPKCGKIKRGNLRKMNILTFINKCNKIHNNKYDYTKVVYTNAHTKVCIICPVHGEFWQIPNNHLKGQGCPICSNKTKGKYQISNTEEFIKKAKEKHGNKYDYSKVEYTNNRVKINITCLEHGEFWQKPNDHLNGHGCPICGKKLDKTEKYILEELNKNFCNVVYQYKPIWLRNKTSPQSLDFYLPDYNIAIEYQGRQHFKPISYFGGDENFIKSQERDLRKYHKCLQNNIKLLYVSFEKEIPEKYHKMIYTSIEDLINEIKNGKNI